MGLISGTQEDVKGRLFGAAYMGLYNHVQSKSRTPDLIDTKQQDAIYADTLSPYMSRLFGNMDGLDFDAANNILGSIQVDPRFAQYSFYHVNDSALSEEERNLEQQKLAVTEFRAMTATDTSNDLYTNYADAFYDSIDMSFEDLETPPPVIAIFQPQEDISVSAPLQITVNGGNVVQWPVEGYIRRGFDGDANKGVDIAVADNTPVHAASDGTVIFAGESEQYGNLVVIKQNDVNYTAYGYVDDMTVSTGDTVTIGQQIAVSGISGDGADPILHFEMRMGADPAPIDPVEVLGNLPAPAEPDAQRLTVQPGGSLWQMVVDVYGEASNKVIQERCNMIAAIPENAATFTENAQLAGRPKEVAQHYMFEKNPDGSKQEFVFPSLSELESGGANAPHLAWKALDAELNGPRISGSAPAGP